MTEAKKPREITAKGLRHKANIAVSALGFFAGYAEKLAAGQIAEDIDEVISPIVRRINEGKLMPTPALTEVQSVLVTLQMAQDLSKAEFSLLNMKEAREPKAYIATIRDDEGNVMTKENEKGEIIELEKDFDKQSDAERWCFNRLFRDAEPSWHGEVLFTKALEGVDDTLIISREDAMAQILRPGKHPYMHKTKTSSNLTSKMKVKGSSCHFSHG